MAVSTGGVRGYLSHLSVARDLLTAPTSNPEVVQSCRFCPASRSDAAGVLVGRRSREDGEPAVPLPPSHVQVTKRRRHLKEPATINFSELAPERLVLFSSLDDLGPRGQQWRFVRLMEHTARHCPETPRRRALKSIFVFFCIIAALRRAATFTPASFLKPPRRVTVISVCLPLANSRLRPRRGDRTPLLVGSVDFPPGCRMRSPFVELVSVSIYDRLHWLLLANTRGEGSG